MDQDLKKDEWRQKTMELLYEVNEYNKTFIRTPDLAKELKIKLKELMINMKKYMDDNKLRDDLFMKMLTDDIFTAHTTFGTSHGHMYVASRQTSQATQGIHNNTIHNNSFYQQSQSYSGMPDAVPLVRGLTCRVQQMDEDDEFDLLLPPPTMKRGVSHYVQAMNEDEDEEDDDDEEEPGDIMNCSMPAYKSVPKLKRSTGRSVGFVDEDNDVFARHVTLESDISPYANLKTMTLMREVSYTPKNPEEEDQDLP
jgi:hypothetical protein